MVSGVSLFLVAVGAVLTWAVRVSVRGVDIHMVGVILMIVGALGALSSLVFWNGPLSRSRRTVVREDPIAGRKTVIEEDRYLGL
ncbi:MAG TPA: DUF6458 family protein [Acidimicrobiia bacterium]|jgi:hypothetical protein|nr:DUF6458 family protein [Acidimicrobiia bacterium]